MDPAVINLNEAAQLIEEMGGKVLNPIRIDDTSMFDSIDQPLFAFVDVETTGFTPGEDEIIQLSIVGAKFDGDRILGRKLLYSSYNEPTKEIPELIREMTGISYETVKGQSIDWQEVDLTLRSSVLIVAHNAAFDRAFIEEHSRAAKEMAWGCTMSQIPWDKYPKWGSAKLEFLLFKYGYFYGAHSADIDCHAGVTLLEQSFPGTDESNLQILLDNARRTDVRVAAKGAAFSAKDKLKDRGYSWKGDDKAPEIGQKYWWIEVPMEELRH
ncbi:MAG: hypothetical protein KDI38_09425, partial [Calditrichaeota bacterium]|nr:hypothetical protein [Calditrichota bacterium]